MDSRTPKGISKTDHQVITRRNALKAGMAVGVGAAAFGGPQIGVLGATPAYAAPCSQPFLPVAVGACDPTSCNCGGGSTGFPKTAQYGAQTITGTVAGGTVEATTAGGCQEDPATVQLTVPATYSGQCRLRVNVYQGNECSNNQANPVLATQTTDSVQSGVATLPIPGVECQGAGNIFLELSIECSGDDDITCDPIN